MDSAADAREELIRKCVRFLIPDHDDGPYKVVLEHEVLTAENLESAKLRLYIHLRDVEEFDRALYDLLLAQPDAVITAFETAVQRVVEEVFPEIWGTMPEKTVINIGIEGELGSHTVSPSELTCDLICKLVRVEGVVVGCSEVRPKLVRAVQYCGRTNEFTTTEYRDALSNKGHPTSAVLPQSEDSGYGLSLEYGHCKFIDHQTLKVQELPEDSPVGQLPRSTEVILEADLVNTCKPGDRISVVGTYKTWTPKLIGKIPDFMEAVVVANSVRPLFRDWQRHVSPQDLRNAGQIAHGPDPLGVLANSLAPSIRGHETIKKGIILLLLGGREQNLKSGMHLRGDIHCLLVGDPGTAKSQLLRAAMHVAEVSVSANGRGSSGVGLTAAVVQDSETGEKQLAPGAMVLADRGIVCIDEFDKMNGVDRVAMHEVLEQQTITIAKAGIHASLNTRCSLLAAANPVFGTYDDKLTVHRNIDLPDSLLSRFDLVFIVRDNMNTEEDRLIAEHVMGQHRYRAQGDDGRTILTDKQERLTKDLKDDGSEDDDKDFEPDPLEGVYAKWDHRLHGHRKAGQKPPLTTDFLKKFILIAKNRGSVNAVLTDEAMKKISEFYLELRAHSEELRMPITVRTLEGIIRLCTASAKLRMSQEGITKEDVAIVRHILWEVMYDGARPDTACLDDGAPLDNGAPRDPSSDRSPQAPVRERRGKRKPTADSPCKRLTRDEDHDRDIMSDEDAAGQSRPSNRVTRAAAATTAPEPDMMVENEESEEGPSSTAGAASSVQVAPSAAELKTAMAEMLSKIFRAKGSQVQVQLAQLVEQYNETARVPASKAAIEQALEELETGKKKTMYVVTNEETGIVDIMDVA